jgi:hypothetical protein
MCIRPPQNAYGQQQSKHNVFGGKLTLTVCSCIACTLWLSLVAFNDGDKSIESRNQAFVSASYSGFAPFSSQVAEGSPWITKIALLVINHASACMQHKQNSLREKPERCAPLNLGILRR